MELRSMMGIDRLIMIMRDSLLEVMRTQKTSLTIKTTKAISLAWAMSFPIFHRLTELATLIQLLGSTVDINKSTFKELQSTGI
jgi:hypothetical protein